MSETLYSKTPRGFTMATLLEGDPPFLELQASSTMFAGDAPSGCLRECDGEPMPGASFLWVRISDPLSGDHPSAHLGREQAAQLASILTRWLATGRLEPVVVRRVEL